MDAARLDKLVLDSIEHELNALYITFEQYGGAAGMKPVTKYDTWRLVEYQRIMNAREKWHALAITFLTASRPSGFISPDTKNKLWEQAIKLDLEDVADMICDPYSIFTKNIVDGANRLC